MLRIFLFSTLFTISILTGCASSVKSVLKTESLKEGAPHAVIWEENKKNNYVTSSIKGIYTDPAKYPDDYETFQYTGSTSGAIAKAAFSLTPWGMIAHGVHHDKGKKIAVPPGRMGILIHHKYYRVLSYKKVNSELIGKKTYDTWETKYQSKEWDSTVWVKLEAGKKYVLKLSALELIGPDGKRVPIDKSSVKEVPTGEMQIKTEEKIKDEKGIIVPKEQIQDEKGDITPNNNSTNIQEGENK